jgi:hypothetical protein
MLLAQLWHTKASIYGATERGYTGYPPVEIAVTATFSK